MTPRIILVVEDAELCAVTLEIALVAVREAAVRVVHSAEEALEEMARNRVGALITDLHLPGMDGFELVERVRRQPPYARLPVIVISGDADPRSPERALRLGADAFFGKPYSPAQVRQKLEELLHA